MADLEPVIADLPTVPSDKVETIEDQLPEVPTAVGLTFQIMALHSLYYFTGTQVQDQNSSCSCCQLVRAYLNIYI